ncbi:MAG: protein translocase subunit SecD, partial [Plesiomonas shigelloides]
MLNRYPLWKYLMVAFVVTIGALYALPNIYGEDPAIQISGVRGASTDMQTLDKVKDLLAEKKLPVKAIALENGTVLVRFKDTDEQLAARDLVADALGDKFTVALNLAPSTPRWLEDIGANPMKLGLDLRGGVHFLMEVDMDAAMGKLQEQTADSFRSELREKRIRYSSVRKLDSGTAVGAVEVRFRSPEELTAALDYLQPLHRDLTFTAMGDTAFIAQLSEARLKEAREYAVQQNITILRNRVNELGVAEPIVQRQGASRIVVELPGIQDTARAKEILGATATLEFRLVNNQADLQAAVSGRVPGDSELQYMRDGRPVLLYKKVVLTGDHITDSSSSSDEYNRPQVNISLDSEGGTKMANFTKDNIGKPMATLFSEYKDSGKRDANGKVILVKHDEVINMATIQSRLGRSFRITGIDSQAEAHNLSLLLRAGALIAPIQIVEERTIGPSLGAQNIQQGLDACMWGLAAVVIFMGIYYRKFGLIAISALLANLVLIVGIMSMLPGATLTMPGIAGI